MKKYCEIFIAHHICLFFSHQCSSTTVRHCPFNLRRIEANIQYGMGWDRLSGTGVATALKIIYWPTPFLTRPKASRLGGVIPMNNLLHSHMCTDEFTPTGATLRYNIQVSQRKSNTKLPLECLIRSRALEAGAG